MRLITAVSLGLLVLLIAADAIAATPTARVSEPGSLSLIAVALIGGLAAYRLRKRK